MTQQDYETRYFRNKQGRHFFQAQLHKLFLNEPRWYRRAAVRPFLLGYYSTLRYLLRHTHPRHRVLTRCQECLIPFITTPSNRSRRDLRCPFGCRKAHRLSQASKRSLAFYQSKEGKVKKQLHNQRRYRQSDHPQHPTPNIKPEQATGLIKNLKFVVELIETRKISLAEIRSHLDELNQIWRQHPLDHWVEVYHTAPP